MKILSYIEKKKNKFKIFLKKKTLKNLNKRK
jgi:hypothetical protein